MKYTLGAALLVAASIMTPVINAAEIELKLAHSWPKGFPIFATSVHEYADMVSEMSDGRIEIKVDSPSKHKAAFGIFDLVKTGQYDIGQSASYYYDGRDPDTLFFTTMPFGMTALEQYAWFHEGGGLELANEVYARHGIEVMTGGNSTMQMGGWFRKEINSVADLKGLKMRIPGFGGRVMADVGTIPVNIPPGELYEALEKGTIDALEWVGPSLDLRMGFHKIAPYYYTGWHEPSSELMYFFNKSKMQSLPGWARSILLNAAMLTSFKMTLESQHESAQNWATMRTEFPDIKVLDFPREVITALRESNDKLIAQERARSPMAAKIIESQAQYLRKIRKWTEIGDWSFITNSAR